LIALRRRVPLLACLLLVLSCLMAVGIVCTCSSDQSFQGLQRIVQIDSTALPAVVEIWGVVALISIALVVAPGLANEVAQRGRASPQLLQRFLF
jgi:hypothetical protein